MGKYLDEMLFYKAPLSKKTRIRAADGFVFLLLTAFALYARFSMFPFLSGDYTQFLSHWYDALKEAGGIPGIGLSIGDYAPSYIYLDVYKRQDEGITGTSTKKRAAFNRMIADAQAHLFDLIVTKEISRFARNTLDSIFYTRKLKELGIGVIFMNDNICLLYTSGAECTCRIVRMCI